MRYAHFAAAAALALGLAPAVHATTYVLTINDPSQGLTNFQVSLGTPLTPHQGWSEGGIQSWGFGTNSVPGGGWVDFFNNAYANGSPYKLSYPAGEAFQLEGGTNGNVSFQTTTPFYTLTGAASTYALSFSTTKGTQTFALTDGGTVSVSAVPEPSAWALMILGIAGVGLMMRRRTTKATLAI